MKCVFNTNVNNKKRKSYTYQLCVLWTLKRKIEYSKDVQISKIKDCDLSH